MQKISLDALAREHLKRARSAPSGRSAETVYGGHEHVLRQALMTLVKGRSLAEHENPGEATVVVLRGRVRVTAGADVWEAREGDLLIVPSARHNLEAVEDSAVLLGLSFFLAATVSSVAVITAPFPPGHHARRDRAGNTVRSTVPT